MNLQKYKEYDNNDSRITRNKITSRTTNRSLIRVRDTSDPGSSEDQARLTAKKDCLKNIVFE